MVFLAKTWNFVSGAYEVRGSGTWMELVLLYSWYLNLSKNLFAWISGERDGLSSWNLKFRIRSIWDIRRGCTRKVQVQLYSWYCKLSKNLLARISGEPDGLSSWNLKFCIRSIWDPKSWHAKGAGPAVLLIFRTFEKFVSADIWRTGRSFWLKLNILCVENVWFEEVARQIFSASCAPDISIFLEMV